MTASPRSAESPLWVGFAGVGRFGALHAAVLSRLAGVELAAVADRHGVSRRYNEAFALIADDSLDAVALATPDAQHPPRCGPPCLGGFCDLVSIRSHRNCSRSSFAAIADRAHTVFRTLIHDIDLQLWNDRKAACPDLSLWPQLEGRVHGALQEQLLDFLAAVRHGHPQALHRPGTPVTLAR